MSYIEQLPVYPFLDSICDSLKSSSSGFLVLTAETAAGKSTAVPLALMSHFPGKILVLEPRKIAALSIAERIASHFGEIPGKRVGYRIHLDTCISNETRIEILTEAIMTRIIQHDPSLPGISVVVIDEFHERSIHSDLVLALLHEVLILRPDLRVLVMSATIDTERVAHWLNCPVVKVPGRQFPVEITYCEPLESERFDTIKTVVRAVNTELATPGGTLLVFLPGISDIRRVQQELQSQDAEILLLHSSIPLSEQRKIYLQSSGKRRVILSSSIAETSITVPDVTIVIDSGLSRISRFDVKTGMNRLVTELESVFSATQRSGRAGRVAAGRCVRLWSKTNPRNEVIQPEILRSDLMQLILECAAWGVSKASDLHWLDSPSENAWNSCCTVLETIGALNTNNVITDTGRVMAHLPLHPRLAAVVIAGNIDGAVELALPDGSEYERKKLATDIKQRLNRSTGDKSSSVICNEQFPGFSVLSGFPDRIAHHVGNGLYQFPSGRIASLSQDLLQQSSRFSEWIVAPVVDAGEREGKIRRFTELADGAALQWITDHAKKSIVYRYDKPSKIMQTRYGEILISEQVLQLTTEDTQKIRCAFFAEDVKVRLPWTDSSESFFKRVQFMHYHVNHQEIGYDDIQTTIEALIIPFMDSNGNLSPENFLQALRYYFNASEIDRQVPSRIRLENGVERNLHYEELDPGNGFVPILEIRIQELFGCHDIPAILGEPVLLRLLSPARRPVQITRDLPGFWKNTWKDVRKELKGRYPKHKWPENPFE